MIDMIDIDKEGSEDNKNDVQETMERNNDTDIGDATTSIMSNTSIRND